MTITSKDFNQNVSKVKRAALNGPVFITDRGRPAYVLLTIEEYQKITKTKQNIVDLLAIPESENIDFKPPKLSKNLHRPEKF